MKRTNSKTLLDTPLLKNKCVSREFTKAIDDTASAHWIDWLETIFPQQIYTANKYVINESSDASCARIPTLKTSTNGKPSMASTNIDKAKALATSFFPSAPSSTSIPQDHEYSILVSGLWYFSHHQIRETAKLLKPHKAPSLDGIPNVILIKCIDTLINHLFFIYRAAIEHNFYHDRWLLSTTLVLHKPGKPAYDVAKAYRPIGLLDTISKLLSMLITADLSHLAEQHNMLPGEQFGSRSGRNTSNAMHIVAHKIKDTWRVGKVTVALFLDLQSAFPNTIKAQLLHNIRACGVPLCYMNLINTMLTGRKIQLKFNDFSLDPININNGTIQSCPLSMILYAFYNAPLIEVALHKCETSLGFVDDSMFLAVANSLSDAHVTVKDMME